MEYTNDHLLTAFTIRAPLRVFLSGPQSEHYAELTSGMPSVAFAIDRYNRGLVQVFKKLEGGTQNGLRKAKKVLNFTFRSANEVYFKWELPMSLSVINDLRVDELPEIKLIKHMCRNDSEISLCFKEAAMREMGFQSTVNLKMQSEMPVGGGLGVGSSASYAVIFASAVYLGLRAAFGLAEILYEESFPII